MQMIDLQDVPVASEAVFGGKACGLARLIDAGAKVPPGFAVEATESPVEAWAADYRAQFCQRVRGVPTSGTLAVRSSAVGEDGPGRSFAGMFETVLDVSGAEEALAAAMRCIASADSERVRSYANGDAPPAVGLVVQAQVDAVFAGVCFTIDPSGKDGALLIEAVAGRGDRLVSGRADPQRWRIYRSGLGTWEVRRDGDRRNWALLPERELIRIAEQAMRHAERIGHPLDLEWAVDRSGELWWLQARPVTAASSPPRFHVDRAFDGVDDGPVTVWSNWNVRETMPDPFMPLTWSLWRDAIIPTLLSEVFGTPVSSPLFPHLQGLDLVHGRPYFNMNAILAWPVVSSLMKGSLMRLIDPEAAEVCEELMSAGVLQPRRLPGSKTQLLLNFLGASLMATRRFATALRPRRAMQSLRSFEAALERRRREHPLSSLTDAELLVEMQLIASEEFAVLKNGLHYEIVALGVYHQATRAFRHFSNASRMLAVGIPDNPTTQISIAIDELVDAARPLHAIFVEHRCSRDLVARLESEPDGIAWLAKLHGFLARFGHRCPREFDLGAPRWSEAPGMIIDLVRAGLESRGSERVTARLERLAAERRAAVQAAVTASPWWRRPVLRGLANMVEVYMPLREAPKHYAMFLFQRMRDAARELGNRLVARGQVATGEDAFFLELTELQRLVQGSVARSDLQRLVTERRARFERFLSERAPDFLRSDGVPVGADRACGEEPGGALRATGVSCGRASGPVRILREPDPKAMADGDVIVMEFADPGWTPLFPRAAAIVMEVGGLMCHAAVVARELGIPAVFGVGGATRILRNGQAVIVDGELGTVTPA